MPKLTASPLKLGYLENHCVCAIRITTVLCTVQDNRRGDMSSGHRATNRTETNFIFTSGKARRSMDHLCRLLLV